MTHDLDPRIAALDRRVRRIRANYYLGAFLALAGVAKIAADCWNAGAVSVFELFLFVVDAGIFAFAVVNEDRVRRQWAKHRAELVELADRATPSD